MVKRKKLIIILSVVLLAISVFSVLSVLLIQTNKDKEKDTSPHAADLTISTFEELKSFANAVNDDNTYAGKTVVLSNDIDCKGNDFCVKGEFKGIFDGRGCSLFNYNISSYLYQTYIGSDALGESHKYFIYGTFLKCSGTIKNLEIKDVECRISAEEFKPSSSWNTNHDLHNFYIAAIVGYSNNALVNACKVTNFNIIEDKEWTNNTNGCLRISNIVAVGNGLISNCIASDIYCDYNIKYIYISGITYGQTVKHTFSASYGGQSKTIVLYPSEGLNIKNCIMKGTFDYYFTSNPNESNFINNCYYEKNDLGFRSISSSKGGNDSIDLYYTSYYNEGWPELRVFIKDWSTVNFSVNPEGAANPPENILIPSDATQTFVGNTDGVIYIYDQRVEANKAIGYNITGFTCVDRLNYVVNYEPIMFTLTFANTIGEESISPSESEMVVSYGSTIKTNKVTAKTEFIYTITALDGTTTEIKYDLTSYGYLIISDFGVEENYIITEDMTITPILDYKDYGVGFG